MTILKKKRPPPSIRRGLRLHKLMTISNIFLLGIVFLTLKLTDTINWSWWIVLLPFYGGFVVGIITLFLFICYGYYKHGRE
jgi:hypothetical protein